MNTPRRIHRRDRDGVAVLELDTPGRSLNVVDEELLDELATVVDEVLQDDDVRAVVLASAKHGSFGGGADVDWLPELAAREDADAFLARNHALMLRLATADTPMVAAVDGVAMGGALELALAAREIVATPSAQLGLPEVTLGLLPGGGGTQLLGRFVAPATAATLLTGGRPLDAEAAADAGLVATVVPSAELEDAAVARAAALAGTTAPPLSAADPASASEVVAARREELVESRRGLAPAAAAILDVLEIGLAEGVEAGLAAERAAFLGRLGAPDARAAMHLFVAERAVRRRSGGAPADVDLLGVVGGGQMGAGIAATATSRGLPVIVRDVEEASLERAAEYRDRVLTRTAPDDGPDDRAADWRSTTAWTGFDGVDAVVEAVFESPEVKDEVLTTLSDLVSPEALVASNTSAIPISRLATSVVGPGRFLGMHFFSPVDRMPLVELIPHEGTAPATVERAVALGRRLGKVPVVVGDAPGFFTSRVYARWLVEGVRLLLDGVPPSVIESAARAVGFPVGPLLAHDEATLDLVLAASITQVAEPVLADRLDVAAVRTALERFVEAGVRGRRHGRGFHHYGEDGRRGEPDDRVLELLDVTRREVSPQLVGERLLLAFATECFLCWDDGTLCHPDDGDVAAVLGIGFPRALGGPFHWADATGLEDVVARCAAVGADAFPVGTSIPRLLESGGRLGGERRRPAPFRAPTEESS